MINKLTILLTVYICMMPSLSHAKYQYEFTPAISTGEVYDDNIDLEKTDKKADWMTTISPSLTMNLLFENDDNFLLMYNPTYVKYRKEDQNNNVRHSATLTGVKSLTNRLELDLNDTFIRTEDPVEATEGIFGARQTRNTYMRNTGDVSMMYLLGPENNLNLGYSYSSLENDDTTLEDNFANYPYAGITYWMSIKNGFEVNYQRTLINYTRNGEEVASDNVSGDTVDLKYLRRFSTITTAFMGYIYNSRFTGEVKDYDIHEGSVGLTYSLSDNVSLSISGGYFLVKNELSDDDNGYSYDVSFDKNLNNGSISISGAGGWREGFNEADRRGFIKYWGFDSTFTYQFMEKLGNYASFSYMRDKEVTDRVTKSLRANYGWTLSFLRWFSISLDYSYFKRDDSLDIEDYNVNRIMLNLTASKVFR